MHCVCACVRVVCVCVHYITHIMAGETRFFQPSAAAIAAAVAGPVRAYSISY